MKKDHVTKQRVAEKREKDTEFLFFDKVEDEETIGQRMEERKRESEVRENRALWCCRMGNRPQAWSTRA